MSFLLSSWLQMVKICTKRYHQDCTGRGLEGSGLDAGQTANDQL